jgi:hypothetical protein
MSIAHLARKMDVYIIPPHSSSSRGHELGLLLLKKNRHESSLHHGFPFKKHYWW